MKNNFFELLLLLFLFSIGNAKIYNFSVISTLGAGKKIAVVYNGGETVEMQPTTFPLYEVSVDVPSITKYHFAELNQVNSIDNQESFERDYEENRKTKHDVYNRVNKEIEIPELPHPFDAQFPMGSEKFQPIPNNVIYNVYIECDNNSYLSLKNSPFIQSNAGNARNDVAINCPVINIVTPDKEFTASGTLRLVGYGSRLYKKLSWLVKLDKKFMGRKSLKLRGVANDPTLIRDKLATSLLKSVGVPVQEGSYARVFINSDIWGLYTFVDTLNPKWVRGYVHGDDDYKLGNAYKMFSNHPSGPFANFEYLGDDYSAYTTYIIDIDEENESNNNTNNPTNSDLTEPDKVNTAENFQTLLNFIKKFNEWKTKYNDAIESIDAVKELETFFNIELTLRIVAIESLVVAVDNFTPYQGNAAIYYNPEQKKYHFLPYDYDEALNGYFTKYFPENAINDCMNWYVTTDSPKSGNFIQTLLKYKPIRDRYLVILAKASRTSYNINSVAPYVDAIANLIRDDVEWNFNIANQYPTTYTGLLNKYTIQNFEGNLNYEPVPYSKDVIPDDKQYGLKQFVELRGKVCQDLTSNIQYSGSRQKYTIKMTILVILSQFMIFFLF